jgi:AbiTii-like protein
VASQQSRIVSAGLLADLQAGLRDDNGSTTSLLQKCILLGGQVGSERLRDWARHELKGYDGLDQVPEYRRISAPLCIDGATLPPGYRSADLRNVAARVRSQIHQRGTGADPRARGT